MFLVRYYQPSNQRVAVGVEVDGQVAPLAVSSMGELLHLSLDDIRSCVNGATQWYPIDGLVMLPPCDSRMEVWAAGVTYERSRDARIEESTQSDVYQMVYDAVRPELFLKALPWRTVTDGEPIAIRRDSALNVPEAELTAVFNAGGEIVAYGICNDVSSRSIEGENPLYLPQAKIYAGSCALASRLRPAWEVDSRALDVTLRVRREGADVVNEQTSTASLRRTGEDLGQFLFAAEHFPDGVILSTGTGIVPTINFTLEVGDEVIITIDKIGTLRNRVVSGKEHFEWLSAGRDRPRLPD